MQQLELVNSANSLSFLTAMPPKLTKIKMPAPRRCVFLLHLLLDGGRAHNRRVSRCCAFWHACLFIYVMRSRKHCSVTGYVFKLSRSSLIGRFNTIAVVCEWGSDCAARHFLIGFMHGPLHWRLCGKTRPQRWGFYGPYSSMLQRPAHKWGVHLGRYQGVVCVQGGNKKEKGSPPMMLEDVKDAPSLVLGGGGEPLFETVPMLPGDWVLACDFWGGSGTLLGDLAGTTFPQSIESRGVKRRQRYQRLTRLYCILTECAEIR